MGRKVFPKVQMTNVIRQMAKKMRRSCQSFAAKSRWYIAIVAEMSEANPKFTDRVIVQFPINQIHPVMNESTVLLDLEIWKDQ